MKPKFEFVTVKSDLESGPENPMPLHFALKNELVVESSDIPVPVKQEIENSFSEMGTSFYFCNQQPDNQQCILQPNSIVTNVELKALDIKIEPDYQEDITNPESHIMELEKLTSVEAPQTSLAGVKVNDDLLVELAIHSKDALFNCTKCRFSCNEFSSMCSHLRTHAEFCKFECEYCKYNTKCSRSMGRHLSVHGDKHYFCDTCHFKCLQPSEFSVHLKTHSKDILRTTCSSTLGNHVEAHAVDKSLQSGNINLPIQTYAEKSLEPDKLRTTCSSTLGNHVEANAEDKSLQSSDINIHMQTHTEKKVCDILQTTRNSRLKKIRAVHKTVKLFHCNICEFKTTQNGTLNVHMQTHTEVLFKCTTQISHNFKTHMPEHTKVKSFQCSVCDYTCFDSKQIKRHKRGHMNQSFQCEQCGRMFPQICQLKSHIQRKHSTEQPLQCLECNYMCSHSKRLATHLCTTTGERSFRCTVCNYKSPHSNVMGIHLRTHAKEKAFRCEICPYKSARSETLAAHLAMHKTGISFLCDICGIEFLQKQNLKLHMRIHSGDMLTCNFCDYKTRNKRTLLSHIQIHSGEKPFQCHLCEYKTITLTFLSDHLRRHSNEKLKCEKCSYETFREGQLKKHLETVHTGDADVDQPFQCKLCDFKYTTTGGLVSHMSQHRRAAYKCDQCSFMTSTNIAFKEHMYIHDGVKTFCCDICSYKGSRQSRLTEHLRIHSGNLFKCTKCSYTCSNTTHLKRHQSIHTGEKRFQCFLCTYKCSQSSNLNVHMRTHDVKSIKCPQCSFEAVLSSDLRKHILSEHTKEKTLL